MPRNGSGSYTPVNVPVISGTTISSSAFNGTINDISTALTQSVSADGQTTITANQNMYGYKHTNVAAAVNGTDYAPLWQVQNGYGKALSAVSGADTITAVTTPGLAAYQAGGLYQFIPAANNATTTPTLNINSLGARSIVWHDGSALKAGNLVQGAIFSLYDDGTKFRVLPTGGSNYGIAGGTVDAITATIAVGAAYADGMMVRVQAAGANTSATPTLNVNSIGAKTIVKLNNQPLIAGDIAGADFVAQLHYDSSLDKWVLENPATATPAIPSITASVASNALTVGLNPVPLTFRSTTLTSGAPVTRTFTSALSLTVPSGATLGTINAQLSRIVLLAIDNAGTVELAVVNISGGNQLDETNLISTTAVSGTSNSANVIYSQTARSNVAYRVVGVVDSTQATAGTWASAPSLVQPAGGQSIAAMSAIGYGQTWQNVAASRALGTTYYNTTGRPIMLSVAIVSSGGSTTFTVGGVVAATASGGGAGWLNTASVVVPPGMSYVVTNGSSISTWAELR